MAGRLGAEVAFTDRSGAHWIRRLSGDLAELTTDAVNHYDIGRPVDYQTCEPV